MSRSRTTPRVLLVDIGNTRIKWAYWQAARIGRPHAEAYKGWSSDDFARHLFGAGRATRPRAPARIIVASVAGENIAVFFAKHIA